MVLIFFVCHFLHVHVVAKDNGSQGQQVKQFCATVCFTVHSNASHVIDVLYIFSVTYARLFQDQTSGHSDAARSKALPFHITTSILILNSQRIFQNSKKSCDHLGKWTTT